MDPFKDEADAMLENYDRVDSLTDEQRETLFNKLAIEKRRSWERENQLIEDFIEGVQS